MRPRREPGSSSFSRTTRYALRNAQGLTADSSASEADTAQTDFDLASNEDVYSEDADASETSAGTEVPATNIANHEVVPQGPEDSPGTQSPGSAVPETTSSTARGMSLGPVDTPDTSKTSSEPTLAEIYQLLMFQAARMDQMETRLSESQSRLEDKFECRFTALEERQKSRSHSGSNQSESSSTASSIDAVPLRPPSTLGMCNESNSTKTPLVPSEPSRPPTNLSPPKETHRQNPLVVEKPPTTSMHVNYDMHSRRKRALHDGVQSSNTNDGASFASAHPPDLPPDPGQIGVFDTPPGPSEGPDVSNPKKYGTADAPGYAVPSRLPEEPSNVPPGPKKPFDAPDPPVPDIIGLLPTPKPQKGLGTPSQTAESGSFPTITQPSEAMNGQLERIALAITGLTTRFDASQLETREKMDEIHQKLADLSKGPVIIHDSQVQYEAVPDELRENSQRPRSESARSRLLTNVPVTGTIPLRPWEVLNPPAASTSRVNINAINTGVKPAVV
ncbi:uncharacterized protein EI90DRAFT_3013191 [Cantharellus anzutake]|uniref:uncharacterized protein n=1 Tax=Cantharellus anzutake TaxID=1750568 RepID=UPI001902C8E2|nr:uncharacterized protein EI90DRAFT_3013191 [Cantharellus anzutake]KAF8339139.1 hypothetical protein EI90DRAFT_3013191 [Cantharellus anzutake]